MKLLCSGDLENPGQLPVSQVLKGTDDWVLMDYRNFFISYVFRSINQFLSVSWSYYVSGDLENPGQLPVSHVLKGTDDWVLWIFVISSFLTFFS